MKLPPFVFLDGESGTGRTAILQQLMDLRGDFYILINTKECYTTRLLYFHMLYGLYGMFSSRIVEYVGIKNTEHSFEPSFVEKLEDAFEEVDSLGIVYQHFQRFEDKKKLRCIVSSPILSSYPFTLFVNNSTLFSCVDLEE